MSNTDLVPMIRNLEEYSLSGSDIQRLVGEDKVILVAYDNLENRRSIWENGLLRDKDSIIPLYRLTAGNNH